MLPGLPTVASAGLSGFESVSTNGLFAPAKTPPPVIERLNRETNSAIARAEFRDKFAGVGMELIGGTPAQFDQFIKTDTERMSKVITAARIRAE